MRVLAVFLPTSAVTGVNAPCQTKKPMTRTGIVHSTASFHENFIKLFAFGDGMMSDRTDSD
jgi:hypothetical protein